MKTQLKGLLTREEAAKLLGVHPSTIARFVATEKRLAPKHVVAGHYLYDVADVEALKRQLYPEGMTYQQAAIKYGVGRNTVKRHFRAARLKPLGWQYRTQTPVFDPAQVADLAHYLGWLESPTNAASDPESAAAEGHSPS